MRLRSGSWWWLAVGSALLAGCRHGAPEPRHPPARLSVPSAGSRSERDMVEAHARYALATVHELNGRASEALDAYYEAGIRDSGNEPLVMEVSRRLLQARQPEKALDLVTRAIRRPRASGTLHARLGFICFQLGRTNDAITANRAAIRREPDSLVGYQNLFLIHSHTKNPTAALAVLDEAGRVSGPGPEFLIGLGELYANFGFQHPDQRTRAFDHGLAVLRRVRVQSLAEPLLRLRLADGFSGLGRDSEAAPIYHDLLQELNDVPYLRDGIRAKLTDFYLRGSDHQRAAEQLEGIVRDHPTDAQAHYILGSLAYASTNHVLAVEQFSRVILLDPELEQAYYDLAGAQLSADLPSDALATLEQARGKFPAKFVLEYLTGLAYSDQKAFTNAVKHFTAAEVIASVTDPRQLKDTFYFQLGIAFERAGDIPRAEKHLLQCLELSPDMHEAQNYLGYLWADRGEKLDLAGELIARALKVKPREAAYLDSMGWVLFKQNRPQEALPYLLDAIRYSEVPDATLYDHLGDVYAVLSEPRKAREAWTRSLGIENSESVRRKLSPSAE